MADERLVVDALAIRSGGGMTVLLGLGPALAAHADVQVRFLVDQETLPTLKAALWPGEVVAMRFSSQLARARWEQTRLMAYAKREGFGTVLGLSNVVPVFPIRSRIKRAVLIQNVAPLISSVRSAYRGRGRLRLEALRALTIASCRSSDLVLTFTRSAKGVVGDIVPRSLVTRVHPARGLRGETPAPTNSQPYALIVADLYRYKGIEDAIVALSMARDSRLRLIVCGAPIERDYETALLTLARNVGVSDRVSLIGRVGRERVGVLLSGASCYLQTSRAESLCLPLDEAMALGVPIASTNIPVAREVCGRNANYYEPGDTSALASLLVQADSGLLARPRPTSTPQGWDIAAREVLEALNDGVDHA